MNNAGDIRVNPEKLNTIRRTLHLFPELSLEEVRTSEFIAEHLRKLGYEVHQGLANTGVVGTLKNGSADRAVGIRAEMDGLPVMEQTGLAYASRHGGKMHACGHDGHMAMLLGAAETIAERRAFNGTVHLIFQPAEELVGGAGIMVKEGLFRRFPCNAVFALHNMPQLPFGKIALKPGPIMAAVDEALITVHGRGGHGASPENASDPIVAGAGIVMALQTIVSRNIRAFDPAVVTVGSFRAGSASNVIPNEARLEVGIRSVDPATRDLLQQRVTRIARAQAESYGMTASVSYQRSYDPTVNHEKETAFIRNQAEIFAGAENIIDLDRPFMGSEDFTYMLQACPGCLFFLGTGTSPDTPPLHHPAYDFNDDILPFGVRFWTRLAEAYLPAKASE
ncbi:MAG: M20 aminoacylase family protein [Desulfobacter sp.]